MSDDTGIESAVKQVLAAVPGADEEAVTAEFEKYLSEFLIPPSDAMRSVMRRFQTQLNITSAPSDSTERGHPAPMKKVQGLSELKADDRNIEIEVEVISHNTRTQQVRGEERDIAFGMLEDNPNAQGETTRQRWSYKDWGGNTNLVPGVIVRIEGASVNEYNGQLSLNINQSSRVVVLKESGRPVIDSSEPMSLIEAGKNEGEVTVIGRVLSLREDVIHRKDGSGTIDVFRGRVGDESGAMSFLSWEPFTHEVGTLVRIERAQVKRYRDNPELNFGRYTNVEVFHDSGFSDLESLKASTQASISSLRDGAGDVNLVVELFEWTERHFTDKEGMDRTIWSGEILDPTGRCRMSSWSELPIDSTKLPIFLKIEGGKVRSWQGIPDITIDSTDQIEILDSPPWQPIDPSSHIIEVEFNELATGTSRAGVRTEATIVSVRDDSGVIFRCPDCRKVTRDGACIDHGEVEGNKDLRIRMVLDDGISTASLIMNMAVSEKFLDNSLEKIEANIADNGKNAFVSSMRENLLGRRMRVEGRSIVDEQGIMFIAEKAETIDCDAVLAATEVRTKWGVA